MRRAVEKYPEDPLAEEFLRGNIKWYGNIAEEGGATRTWRQYFLGLLSSPLNRVAEVKPSASTARN